MGAPYESWLNLSVDHVVPGHLGKAGWPKEWVFDRINLVTCCRACNEFLNGYRVSEPTPPLSFDDFIVVRDRVFDEKLAHAQKRHAIERERYAAGRPAGPSDVPGRGRRHDLQRVRAGDGTSGRRDGYVTRDEPGNGSGPQPLGSDGHPSTGPRG